MRLHERIGAAINIITEQIHLVVIVYCQVKAHPSVYVIICFNYINDRLPTHTSELCQKLIIMLL